MATNTSGGIGRVVPQTVKTFMDTLEALRDQKRGIPRPTDWAAVREQKGELAKYLGTPDYAARDQEATNFAKLQMALAIAGRGLAGMGEAPRPGESAISTFGRSVLAPITQDVSPIAARLSQERRATKTAREQEERQLKLAAFQHYQTQEAERLTTALKLMPKAAANTLDDTIQYVLKQDDSKKWQFVPQVGGKGRAQVRLQKGTGAPYDIQSQTLRPLTKGEIVVKASELEGYGLFLKPDKAAATKITDMGLAQEWIQDPKDSTKLVLGPRVETKGLLIDGVLRQVIPIKDGTENEIIEIGDTRGKYKLYEKAAAPVKAPVPKGRLSQESKDNFSGFLFALGDIQEDQNLGRIGIKVVPGNVGAEIKVDHENPVFVRADGTSLPKDDYTRLFNLIETGYYNYTNKAFRAGEDLEDINLLYGSVLLNRGPASLGLPEKPIPRLRAEIPAIQIRSPVAITARYKEAPVGFKKDPVAQVTFDRMPVPRTANLPSGIGKARLYSIMAPEMFGKNTTSPPPVGPGLPAADRSAQIAEQYDVHGSSIQDRIWAEAISKGTSLAGKLTSKTNTQYKRNAVLGEALVNEKEKFSKLTTMDKKNRELVESIGLQLHAIRLLDEMSVDAYLSGVEGFVFGPVEKTLWSVFNFKPGGWFRDKKGQEAAQRFIGHIPVMQQLVTRRLLENAGEDRKSNQDLKGMQKTLSELGRSEEYNAAKIRSLRGYLVGNLQVQLDSIGTWKPSNNALLTTAAQLGFDIKGIKGKNNYYNPYLADKKYAVTNQPVPTYSRNVQELLRKRGILSYVASKTPGISEAVYTLIRTDNDGRPLYVDKNKTKPKTITLTEQQLTEPMWQTMIDYNVNHLKLIHKIHR